MKDVTATVYLDSSVHDAVKTFWLEAERDVKKIGGEQQQKGKGKGKGKGRFDTNQGDFPFEYKLAEVKDWNYDSEVIARQQRAEQDDLSS